MPAEKLHKVMLAFLFHQAFSSPKSTLLLLQTSLLVHQLRAQKELLGAQKLRQIGDCKDNVELVQINLVQF